YQQTTNEQVHIALVRGHWKSGEPILTRINSNLVNNDILGTVTNNPDQALKRVIDVLNSGKSAAMILIHQSNQDTNPPCRPSEHQPAQSAFRTQKASGSGRGQGPQDRYGHQGFWNRGPDLARSEHFKDPVVEQFRPDPSRGDGGIWPGDRGICELLKLRPSQERDPKTKKMESFGNCLKFP